MIKLTPLQQRILRGLRSGSTMDFTYANLANALTVNRRRVRRALKELQAAGLVGATLVGPDDTASKRGRTRVQPRAEWSAA